MTLPCFYYLCEHPLSLYWLNKRSGGCISKSSYQYDCLFVFCLKQTWSKTLELKWHLELMKIRAQVFLSEKLQWIWNYMAYNSHLLKWPIYVASPNLWQQLNHWSLAGILIWYLPSIYIAHIFCRDFVEQKMQNKKLQQNLVCRLNVKYTLVTYGSYSISRKRLCSICFASIGLILPRCCSIGQYGIEQIINITKCSSIAFILTVTEPGCRLISPTVTFKNQIKNRTGLYAYWT